MIFERHPGSTFSDPGDTYENRHRASDHSELCAAFAQRRDTSVWTSPEAARYTPAQLRNARTASALATALPFAASIAMIAAGDATAAAGAVVMAGSYIAGPSVGLFKTGRTWPAVRGMLLRITLPTAGFLIGTAICGGLDCPGDTSEASLGGLVFIGISSLGIVSAVHDIHAAGKPPRK